MTAMTFHSRDDIHPRCLICDQEGKVGEEVFPFLTYAIVERAGSLELGGYKRGSDEGLRKKYFTHTRCTLKFLEHFSAILGHLLNASKKLPEQGDIVTPAKVLFVQGPGGPK